jgi:N-acetylglucosaminyldiphosphoundecaprenol N-acetyl-beta-D-mannosaminyltransferase
VIVTTPQRVEVLGLPVDLVKLEDALASVDARIQAWRTAPSEPLMQIVTVNAEMAIQALRSPDLRAVFERSALVVPDGEGVVWALSRQGIKTPKVAGVQLVEALAARAAQCGWRLAFLGAAPGVARQAADKLATRYRDLQVVYVRDGFFTSDEEGQVREALAASGADVLFVALGVPRQEIWLAKYQSALGIPVGMGVGGSFDVLSGRILRAPAFFQRLKLEWFYRLLKEPWRLSRLRQTLPSFVWRVLREGSHKSVTRGEEGPS